MPDNIPRDFSLTVGNKETYIDFMRRAMMDVARRVGLPLLEQVYFADYFYPLCGTPRANLQWKKGFDPSPNDSLNVKAEEFVSLRGKTLSVPLTAEQRTELERRRDYYTARGGKLFSIESPLVAHTAADEYVSPCTAQELVGSQFKSAIECRASALRKLIEEIGARADLYPSDSKKALKILGTAYSGAKGGAVVGAWIAGAPSMAILAPVGGAVGGAVGAAGGAAVGVYLAESTEYNVEARPVKNFLQRTVECKKLAKVESYAKREAATGTSMSAGIQQIMVVTKQFGIFALYPFTLKRGPTLAGDYIIEEHGANPTDPVKRSFGK